jgi:hypothetical protein
MQLYLLIVKSKVFANPGKADRLYLMLGFVLPFIPVLVALIGQVYAPAGVWYVI